MFRTLFLTLTLIGLFSIVAKADDAKLPWAKEKRTSADRVVKENNLMGSASHAYSFARENPDLLKHLFCYAGDDWTEGHTTLFDCFVTNHAMAEYVCQQEALLAEKLSKEGKTLAEIQRAIDEKYGPSYPFESDTLAYQVYKARRLWRPTKPEEESAIVGPATKLFLQKGNYQKAEEALNKEIRKCKNHKHRARLLAVLSIVYDYDQNPEKIHETATRLGRIEWATTPAEFSRLWWSDKSYERARAISIHSGSGLLPLPEASEEP